MKGNILIVILLVTIAAGVILKLTGGNPLPPIGMGLVMIILVYALMDMPPRHKTFTYRDQLKGALHSRCGNPPPEAPHPDEDERQRIEREPAQQDAVADIARLQMCPFAQGQRQKKELGYVRARTRAKQLGSGV